MRLTTVLIKTICASISLHQASRSARAQLFSTGPTQRSQSMPRFCAAYSGCACS